MPVVEHESPRPPQRTAALAFGIYERRSRLLWSIFYILVKPSLWCEGGAQSRSASPEHVVAHQPARGWFVKNSCTLQTTSADAHSSCDRSVLALTTPICIRMTGLRLATNPLSISWCGPSTAESCALQKFQMLVLQGENQDTYAWKQTFFVDIFQRLFFATSEPPTKKTACKTLLKPRFQRRASPAGADDAGGVPQLFVRLRLP